MIPVEWLQERLNEAELEVLARREVERLDLDGFDVEQYLAGAAFARWRQNWASFLRLVAPGDEIWTFTSPPELWKNLAGAAGYAIVRDGKPVHTLASRRS